MNTVSRRLALLAAVFSLAIAAAFAVLLPRPQPGPPEEVQRAVAVSALLAVPGVLGVIGALRAARPVLVAAGVLSLLQSVISFAGVTLVFLMPALLFPAAAGEPAVTLRAAQWRPRRLLVALVLAIPLAWAIVQLAGIAGILGLVVVAGVARGRVAHPLERPGVRRRGAVLGVALVALVVGAWLGLLGTTEERCWIARESSGGLVYERAPVSQQSPILGGPNGAVGYGCGSGELTATGFALAAVLAMGAVSLAATVPLGPRPRRNPPHPVGSAPRPGR